MALQHRVTGTRPIDRTGIRATRTVLAFAWLIAVAAPASAEDHPPRTVGDWTIAVSGDEKGCFLTRTYDRPGRTTLILGLDGDGTNHLSVLNANWSIKPRDQLSLDFRFSKGGYAGHGAIGMAADGQQGFVTTFEAKFPVYFAASKVLAIFRGDVPVERLGLDDSGAAVAALRDCVGLLSARRPVEPAVKARATGIPVDPFASDAPRPRKRKR